MGSQQVQHQGFALRLSWETTQDPLAEEPNGHTLEAQKTVGLCKATLCTSRMLLQILVFDASEIGESFLKEDPRLSIKYVMLVFRGRIDLKGLGFCAHVSGPWVGTSSQKS